MELNEYSDEQLKQLEAEKLQNFEIISQLKEEYEDVYSIMIHDNEFIYRLISPKTYIEFHNITEDISLVKEMVCKECVISPIVEDWNNDIYAGFVETVADAIIDESLVEIDDINRLNMVYRVEKNKIDNILSFQLPLIINRAFNYKSIEEIEKWSIRKQMLWLARASWILENYEDKVEITIEQNG